MEVRECITKNPELISPETSIVDAARRMSECDIGSLFIRSGDELVGVITDRDIVTRGCAKGINLQSPVKDIMTSKVLYCYETDVVEDVAENLAKNQVHRLPVLDQNKKLVGVVSLSDLSRKGQREAMATAFTGIAQP